MWFVLSGNIRVTQHNTYMYVYMLDAHSHSDATSRNQMLWARWLYVCVCVCSIGGKIELFCACEMPLEPIQKVGINVITLNRPNA